jgi:hypothetical protein
MKLPCYIYPHMLARQRLGKHVLAATNSYGPCCIKYLFCDPFYLSDLFLFITPSFLYLLNAVLVTYIVLSHVVYVTTGGVWIGEYIY